MRQSELERAVARQTGETRQTIRQRGFSLLDDVEFPADHVGLTLDCPGCGAVVPLSVGPSSTLPELAECGRCDAAYPYTAQELTTVGRCEPICDRRAEVGGS